MGDSSCERGIHSFQMSTTYEVEGLCDSASKVKCSEDMTVTLWKSVSRNPNWMLKPKSEIIYKRKAVKHVADKSGQTNNPVQGDALKVEET